jgi:acetoin utilization deacetylase AcuC-like enzyme
MSLAFLSDPRYTEHVTGAHHPERPDRIRAIARAVRLAGLVMSPDPFPEFEIDLGLKPLGLPPLVELGPPEPVEERWLLTVHGHAYVEHVRHVSEVGGVLDQGDTPVMPGSYETALLAVGGVLQCCDSVVQRRVTRAFAAVRPPGHHAEPDRPMGFCLFSNVAIAARYLQQRHGVGRIAIVDFDVHHGNGTQAMFESDADLFYASTHQSPLYPGTGASSETGVGNIVNAPLRPNSGSPEFRYAFGNIILPALADFRPDFLIVSAGFDAHRRDPLAQLNLTEDDYDWVTRQLTGLAERLCGSRLVSSLEGGYDLQALGASAAAHVRALMAA